MSTASAPIEQYAQFDPSKHPRGKPENAGEFAPKGSGSSHPAAKPTASPEAGQSDDLDDEGHAANWNAVIKDHGKATPQQLKHAMIAVEHMRQHHASNPHLTPEQRTAMMGMLDSHHAKIQQALASHDKPEAAPETPPDDESRSAPAGPKTGSSVIERHHAAGQKIDLAPAPVKDLLRSLHNLRDTKRNGHVQTKELGSDYAKEMYDHLKSNKRSGDGFGDVHDMSSELGHGAMGYSSPAGNLAIIPPKFKNDDFDVRYTLPHESQHEPDQPSPQPSEQSPSEPESVPDQPPESSESFPWETEDQPAEPEMKDGKPVEHWQALDKLKENGFNDKRNPIGKKITEMVGDDPIQQHGLHQAVLQTHRDLDRERVNRNHAYTSLLGQFVGPEGEARAKFIRQAKRVANSGGDYSELPRFDEMVEMVQNQPEEYGSLLQHSKANRTDISQALMDRFTREDGGLEKAIPLSSDDVLAEAASRLHHGQVHFSPDDPYYSHQKNLAAQEHAHRLQADPIYREQWNRHNEDINATPFSRSGHKLRYEKIRQWLASSHDRWRKYARQLGFVWGAEQEALHPRALGGEWTDKEGHAPGAPAPHAAKPATAPSGFSDLPLFSQPKQQSQPAQPVEPPVPEAPITPPEESPAPEPSAVSGTAIGNREQSNRALVSRFQTSKDQDAIKQLLHDNTGLVMKIARKYAHNNQADIEDYAQSGMIGLIQAADKFDPSKGKTFGAFAQWYIGNEITKNHRTFHPGERSKHEQNKVKTIAASQLATEDGGDDQRSIDELAVDSGSDPSDPMSHMDLGSKLHATLEALPERESTIFKMRHGLSGHPEHKFKDIAAQIGMTRQGVERIYNKVLQHVQHAFTAGQSSHYSKPSSAAEWQSYAEKYGLSWQYCCRDRGPDKYGMLDGNDAQVIAEALAEWYWNLPDRRDRERADHYAKQLGFNFGDAPPAPAAQPTTAPGGGGWGNPQEDLHPRATSSVTIAGKTYTGGQWIPKDQAAQAMPADKSKIEMVSKSGAVAQPAFSTPKNAKSDIHFAFEKVIAGDRKSSLGQGHSTLVSMEDLRRHLPQYSKEELDAEIRKLRESGDYTMETAHGRTTPEMRDAGIKEGSDNLIWISRR